MRRLALVAILVALFSGIAAAQGFRKEQAIEGAWLRAESGRISCLPTVRSHIDGEFEGWDGDTIVELVNGQVWEQAEYVYAYAYRYMPEVAIYAASGRCKMLVEGMDEAVAVRRIR